MKYSIQFSNAIHILAYIYINKDTDYLSSQLIASSVETNPTNIRKIMGCLKKAGLIETTTGKARPVLTRDPKEVTLLDVYKSIEGDTHLIQVDTKTNPNCLVGANIQEVLSSQYQILQQKVELEMATITLDQIIEGILANKQGISLQQKISI